MKSKLSMFTLTRGDINIPLKNGRNRIVRQKGIGAQYMSKYHGIIYVMEKENRELIMFIDQSLNGTYINNRETHIRNRGVILKQGDNIGFGHFLENFKLNKIDTITLD